MARAKVALAPGMCFGDQPLANSLSLEPRVNRKCRLVAISRSIADSPLTASPAINGSRFDAVPGISAQQPAMDLSAASDFSERGPNCSTSPRSGASPPAASRQPPAANADAISADGDLHLATPLT